MKVERTVLFKFEATSQHSGVLSLLDSNGVEVASDIVSFDGGAYSTMGSTIKAMIKRSEYLYG